MHRKRDAPFLGLLESEVLGVTELEHPVVCSDVFLEADRFWSHDHILQVWGMVRGQSSLL